MNRTATIFCLLAAASLGMPGWLSVSRAEDEHGHASHDSLLLSDDVTQWQEIGEDFPDRPLPVTEWIEDQVYEENRERNEIIEEAHETGDYSLLDDAPQRRNIFGGNPFLASGPLHPGYVMPSGAVWQPSLIIYGEMRTALQTFDRGFGNTTEWANRLDLFGNLYLTPTERFLFGFRPLDRSGEFTGFQFEGDDEGFFETFSARVQSFFFEGDLGELFPNLDPDDHRHFDYGIAIGRQPLNFQDGILINDSIDSIGLTRASLFAFGANATRITALFGFNQVHRGNNRRDPDAYMFGILTSMDYDKTTLEADLVFVDGDPTTGGDGLHAGIGDTRRIGEWNSTTRFNYSWALEDRTAAVNTGGVLTSQLSRTMTFNEDIFYFDTFYGFGDFTSAARDPAVGGPLGIIGILYSSVGLSDYLTPLGNQVGDSVGFASGYQHFIDNRKASLIAEIGGRVSTESGGENSAGAALRYQKAMNQHSILQMDAFCAKYDDESAPGRDDIGFGARCEWRIKF